MGITLIQLSRIIQSWITNVLNIAHVDTALIKKGNDTFSPRSTFACFTGCFYF